MNKIKVLLADNHTLFREGTRSVIEREADIKVVGGTGDSAEAIKLAGKTLPHVVLMDITLPGLNGTEAIRLIKAASPLTAVLIFTADDADTDMIALIKAGAAGCLDKNTGGEDLVNAIRAVHAGEAVLNPEIARELLSRLDNKEHQPHNKKKQTALSQREMEILKLTAGGMSNQDIAIRLYLSRRTVQAHIANIFRKINAGSRTEAVMQAMRKGLFRIDDLR